MSYNDRLQAYEQAKAKLRQKPLSDKEYEREIKLLAKKWRI